MRKYWDKVSDCSEERVASTQIARYSRPVALVIFRIIQNMEQAGKYQHRTSASRRGWTIVGLNLKSVIAPQWQHIHWRRYATYPPVIIWAVKLFLHGICGHNRNIQSYTVSTDIRFRIVVTIIMWSRLNNSPTILHLIGQFSLLCNLKEYYFSSGLTWRNLNHCSRSWSLSV